LGARPFPAFLFAGASAAVSQKTRTAPRAEMWRLHDQPALRLGFAILLAAFDAQIDELRASVSAGYSRGWFDIPRDRKDWCD